MNLNDLKAVRAVLGQSQRELAGMLGVSTRAVQSYEQGWRPVPDSVSKLLGVLLYLYWKRGQRRVLPCWRANACSRSRRSRCDVYRSRAGELCWMFPTNHCEKPASTWRAKLADCARCQVMTRWLGTA